MRTRITILAAVLTVFIGTVQAQEIQCSDFSGMVYVNVPFGGSAKMTKEGLTFGSTSSMPFGLSTQTVIIGAIGYGIYEAVED